MDFKCSKEGCNRTAVGKSKIDGKLYCDRYCQPDSQTITGNIGATQLKPGQTIISVDGHATVKHEADEAFVHFEIQVDDTNEDAAWRNGWAQDTKLQKALKGFFMEFNSETRVRLESEDRGDPSPPQRGPKESYVSQQRSRVAARRDYEDRTQPIIGYTATFYTVVTLIKNRKQLDLDALLQWVQKFASVTKVSYDVHLADETLESVRASAYTKAIERARRLAESMATASGFRLSQLLLLEQGTSYGGEGNGLRSMESATTRSAKALVQQHHQDEPTNIISVNASVNMKFLLEPLGV